MSDQRPLLAGVAGWPILHSKSPVLFDHWFRTLGVPGRYVPLAVRTEDFAEVYRALPKAGFRGLNVTIPHKLAALSLADTASDAARAIGAANMIRFTEDGAIHADNTDAYGFIENLRQEAPDWAPSGTAALILGAGGAARAVIYGLLEAGVTELRVTNRTREKAAELSAHFGSRIEIVDWEEREEALSGVATLVNTTSLGMTGHGPLDLDLSPLPPDALVTDIVYSPLETPLLRAASARGNPVVDGLGMLLHQARPAFHAWFGIDPPVDRALRAACLGQGA